MRTLALVDGEHYPPVTRAALEVAAERGHEVVAALLVGGRRSSPPVAVSPTSACPYAPPTAIRCARSATRSPTWRRT